MILCDDGHEKVCYQAMKCPVCEKMAEIEGLEGVNVDRDDEIEDLNNQLKEKEEG